MNLLSHSLKLRAGCALSCGLCFLALAVLAAPTGGEPVSAEEDGAGLRPGESLPQPGPYSRTNLTFRGNGRQRIYHQLDVIRMDTVGPWQNLPLGEAVRLLNEAALRGDPDQRGINFIISPNADTPAGSGAIDASTSLALAGGIAAEPQDMARQVTIKIDPPLHDLRLADVLDAIVKVADPPIKYSIEDYAVLFTWKGRETKPLYFRTIKVDPGTFEQGLQGVSGIDWGAAAQAGSSRSGGTVGGGGGGLLTTPRVNVAGGGVPPGVTRTNAMDSLQAGFRKFLASLGVDLSPPKTLFYGDREGTLLIYASLADLDTIERAVGALNHPPPQIRMKARFVELPEAEVRAFTAQYAPSNSPQFLAVRLTPSQVRKELQRWRLMDGVDLLADLDVTTVSGRPTQVRADRVMEVLDHTNSVGSGPQLKTNRVELGPIVDLIPSVSADGFAVQLGMVTSFNEFIGYDDPGPFVIQGGGTPVAVPPVPHFRPRQTNTSVSLWDGQTVVLDGLPVHPTRDLRDEIPQSGGVTPATGRRFRGEANRTNRRCIVVLVTPVVVGPGGKRLHTENEMPFIESGFPPEVKSITPPPSPVTPAGATSPAPSR